jgi:spore maturation protein CgeB
MRIFILGSTEGYNLEGYVSKAFKDNGIETYFAGYLDYRNRLNSAIRLSLSRSRNARELLSRIFFRRFILEVEKEIDTYNPDSIIIFKGDFLRASFFKEVRKRVNSKIIFWFPDDPRFFNSLSHPIASVSDLTVTFSDKARIRYRDLGINSVRIPFGASDIHSYIRTECKYDISFIGNVGSVRLRMIRKLIKDGFKVRVFGNYWSGFIPSYVIGPPVYGPEFVRVVNESKISLNFHQDKNYGPNMRFFEITGSGGLMVTDNAEDSKEFIDERGAIYYENYEELREKIIEAMREDNIKLKEYAYSVVHGNHMYKNRISNLTKLI